MLLPGQVLALEKLLLVTSTVKTTPAPPPAPALDALPPVNENPRAQALDPARAAVAPLRVNGPSHEKPLFAAAAPPGSLTAGTNPPSEPGMQVLLPHDLHDAAGSTITFLTCLLPHHTPSSSRLWQGLYKGCGVATLFLSSAVCMGAQSPAVADIDRLQDSSRETSPKPAEQHDEAGSEPPEQQNGNAAPPEQEGAGPKPAEEGPKPAEEGRAAQQPEGSGADPAEQQGAGAAPLPDGEAAAEPSSAEDSNAKSTESADEGATAPATVQADGEAPDKYPAELQ